MSAFPLRFQHSIAAFLSGGGVLGAALFCLSLPAQAQLQNGSFESVSDPITQVTLYTTAELYGSADNWTISGLGDIQFTGADYTTDGFEAAVFNGGNGPSGNVLLQTFGTKASENYGVSFDFGGASGNSGTEDMLARALNGATVLGQLQVMDPVPLDLSRTGFSSYSFTFASTGTATTLSFNDIGSDTIGIDGVLDNVKVVDLGPAASVGSAPEPASLVLLLLSGFLAVIPEYGRRTGRGGLSLKTE